MATFSVLATGIILFLHLLSSGDGVKITMLHMFGGSHHMTTKVIADVLARRGHEVTICVPGGKKRSSPTLKIINFYPGFTDEKREQFFQSVIKSQAAGPLEEFKGIFQIMRTMVTLCENLILDKNAMDEMTSSDVIVAELMMFCPSLIAKVLNKPWIGILPFTLATFPAGPFRIPINPSYVPFFKSEFDSNMGFGDRLVNTIMHKTSSWIFPYFINHQFTNVKSLLGFDDKTDILEMLNEAKIAIGNCDFALDFNFPLMPNTFCAGTFLTEPAKQLPDDLEAFVNTSTDGFILVAFGTVFNKLSVEQVQAMAGAFGKLKQKVIWQLQEAHGIPLPKNIKTLKWLPQNDLLGHKQIKLFVSHMGISSAQQAVYHGVPVLSAPRVADQWSNAARLRKVLKMADVITLATATEEEWSKKLNMALTNESFLLNAKKASRRLKTKKHSAREVAADLIEYVIDNDYDVSHLQTPALKMPWYIHNLWDVYFFLFGIALLIIIVSRFIWKGIVHLCRTRKTKAE